MQIKLINLSEIINNDVSCEKKKTADIENITMAIFVRS